MEDIFNIIFLDVDGVIKPSNKWFDEKCILRLSKIINSSNVDCKIILSSDWRLHGNKLKEVSQILEQYNIIISDVTENFNINELCSRPICSRPTDLEEIRSIEILKSALKHNPNNFISLDDMDLNIKQNILINYKIGIQDKDVEKAIKKLNLK